MPSIWDDNSPLVIYESYALGKPVIARISGGVPEIIVNGQTGFLFAKHDYKKLVEIINNFTKHKQLSKNLGKEASAFAKDRFSAKDHYLAIKQIYKDLIS